MTLGDVRPVAVLDANALYPFRQRDLLLHFFDAGLFRAVWSERILDEWTRNLVARRPDFAPSIRSQLEAMRVHFPDAMTATRSPDIEALSLPDPDDRHVLATAVAAGASVIVTDNIGDFPQSALAEFAIVTRRVDDFLCDLFDTDPYRARDVVDRLRQRYRNPAFTAVDFIGDLRRRGLLGLADRL